MPSTSKTPLGLSQWIGGDRPKMGDFNSDNQKIDLACRGVLENLSRHLEQGGHLTGHQVKSLENSAVHTVEGIATQEGIHGLRYFNNKLQVNVGGQWVDCTQGGVGGAYKVYGVCIDMANSHPDTAVTRTDDSVGLTPDAPQWEEGLFGKIRPCVFQEGPVRYYLNPQNYLQREDGTLADHTDGDKGDVMVEIPRMAYAIYQEEGKLYVKVTDHPDAQVLDSRFCYLAHTRGAQGDRNALYVGAYLGWSDQNRLRSLSGKLPDRQKTMAAFRQLAKAGGDGYDLLSFYPYTLLQCLYLVRYASRDCQSALGTGLTDVSGPVPTGGTNQGGMYQGEDTYYRQMKCLGIEDLWGNLHYLLDGIRSDAGGNLYIGTQNLGEEYQRHTNHGKVITAPLLDYASQVQGTNTLGFLMKEKGGDSLLGYCDESALRADRVCYVGASYNDWNYGGIFRMTLDLNPTVGLNSLGARLMYL